MIDLHEVLLAAKLAAKQASAALIVDSQVTANSSHPVASSGIYDFTNSSVATNTAYFRGTYNSVEELEAYSGELTNNDYAFVVSTDAAGNTVYNRYKYVVNGDTGSWQFEYALNNSSFTAAQWAAINSGMSSTDKTTLDTLDETITPMTQAAYDELEVKDKPLYFIYEP